PQSTLGSAFTRIRSWHPQARFASSAGIRPPSIAAVPQLQTGRIMRPIAPETSRRQFLKFLAASPRLGLAARAQLEGDGIITSPAEALNVFDFEPAAKKALAPKPAHWGYMATAVDGDATVRANRDGFQHFGIRPRRLVDTSKVDTTTKILGM